MGKSYRGEKMLNDTRYGTGVKPEKPKRNEHKECMNQYAPEFIEFLIDTGFTKPEIDLYNRDLMAGFGSVVGSVLKNGHHESVIPRNARDCFTFALAGTGFPHCKVAVGQFESFIKKVAEGRMTIPHIAQPGKPLVTRRVLAGIDENQPVTLVEKPLQQETQNDQLRPPVEMTEITEAIAAVETMAVREAMDEEKPQTQTQTESEPTMENQENTQPQNTQEAQAQQPAVEQQTTVKEPEIKITQKTAANIALESLIAAERSKAMTKGILMGGAAAFAGFLAGTAIGLAIRKFKK